ncbi:hypothetical protein ASA1KI_37910 [Opitutales bacterium ASA1]|nr:hypothetical protein ASA1KI_37910 [Opitutales bacterium ASA1]
MHPSRISAFARSHWPTWAWSMCTVLALMFILRADLSHLAWVDGLAREGSPPPPLEASSKTGYAHDQRHFLGAHDRGESWRWISATQTLLAEGFLAEIRLDEDNAPEGRPLLAPRAYAAWLASVAWVVSVFTDVPVALGVERAALWEPVVAHLLIFAITVGFLGRRHGHAAAGLGALFFALFPPISAQFLPGAPTARTWALFFAAAALVRALPRADGKGRSSPCGAASAVFAGLALWLDPAFGFPAVLVCAVVGVVSAHAGFEMPRFGRWGAIGAAFTLAAWLVDRAPWDTAAGELRFVHPLYAAAWAGLALVGVSWVRMRRAARIGFPTAAGLVAGLALIAPLVYVQFAEDYPGWLHAGASMRRFTALDETRLFASTFEWLTQAGVGERFFLLAPFAALVAVATALWRKDGLARGLPLVLASIVVALLLLAVFRVRWGVIAMALALPVCAAYAASVSTNARRGIGASAGLFLFALLAWSKDPGAAWTRPVAGGEWRRSDLEALIHRQFSHWLPLRTPGIEVTALAPPVLSDSLAFHGGARALASTAWESHVGLVATSRILSSLESSEAEAVLQNRQVTHIVLASWDAALPLLVRKPDVPGKDTLYDRLDRWVFPLYLRPIPYHVPATPGFLGQKLAVFRVVPPQDEALSLARLAEYFVELERPEPAAAVARVLAEAFPDDSNAAVARALVHLDADDRKASERELERLEADVAAGRVPFSWDRRVQRTVVLALGRRTEAARRELEACLASVEPADLIELTPLQAHRLVVLARGLGIPFPNTQTADLATRLGAQYAAASR